ncbi:MAG: hypothetical protein ABIJ65_15295 [Chloroflexota bacterium]
MLEGLSRLPIVQKITPLRSVDNYHYQFELKWFRLQKFVEQNEGVDIIFVGSSLVNTGVDPEIVARAYFNKSDIQVRIFNFGVEGLTVSPNSLIVSILEEEYHPALIVFVTEMRDYIAGNGLETETKFLSNSWIRYKLGENDPLGWIIDNSAFLQLFLPYRNWMRSDFPETMSNLVSRYKDMSASGYEIDNNSGKSLNDHPDPNDPQEAINFQQFGNYKIDPTRLQNLKNLIDIGKSNSSPTSTLVIEMPVHPAFYIYVGGDQVHRDFQDVISAAVEAEGGTFLPAEACLNTIPSQGRSNLWHLNYIGAPYFSNCLGDQLAILAHQLNTDFISETNSKREIQ